MIINESREYTISEKEYLSPSKLKKMNVGSRLETTTNKSAIKVKPDSWDLDDRVGVIRGISSVKLADILEDENILVYEK